MPGSGSAELRAIAARLRATGQRDLRLQMTRGLRAGVRPLVPAVKAAARAKLPHTGGLNEHVARQRVTVSVTTGRAAGVQMSMSALDTAQTDAGTVNHPVFPRKVEGPVRKGRGRVQGSREKWVNDQPIPQAAGWWSDTLAAGAPVVQAELAGVLDSVLAQIAGT